MSNEFLLDIHVLSELMRERPDASVPEWFVRNPRATMRTSTITQAEILTGIALLPAGKHRMALAAEQMFEQDFAGRCHRLDTAAAKNHALTVATHNARDFETIDGLTRVNPWQGTASH